MIEKEEQSQTSTNCVTKGYKINRNMDSVKQWRAQVQTHISSKQKFDNDVKNV